MAAKSAKSVGRIRSGGAGVSARAARGVDCVPSSHRWKIREALCHSAAASFAIVFIAAPLFMLLDRRPVIQISDNALTPTIAHPGDHMTVTWTAKEYRNCAGTVRRRVIDGIGKIHEFKAEQTNYHETLKDSNQFQGHFMLPVGLAPGAATYAPIVERYCNVVQQYFWPMRDDPPPVKFTILPAP